MKNINRLGLSIISGSFLALAAWGLPATALASGALNNRPPAAENAVELQSVSGTISTVQRDSFTLVTTASSRESNDFQQDRANTKVMMFIIDKDTAVDGRLKVGANADVAYREDSGNNIAISVAVAK
jgi:hypothetical protein